MPTVAEKVSTPLWSDGAQELVRVLTYTALDTWTRYVERRAAAGMGRLLEVSDL